MLHTTPFSFNLQMYIKSTKAVTSKFCLWGYRHFKDIITCAHSTASVSGLSKTFYDSSVVKVYIKHPLPQQPHPKPQTSSFVRMKLPSISLTEARGGGGEAVSSGSTLLWSSLDQGPRLDVNTKRSSPQTARPVTLLQDRLTDNAFTVSLQGLDRKSVV